MNKCGAVGSLAGFTRTCSGLALFCFLSWISPTLTSPSPPRSPPTTRSACLPCKSWTQAAADGMGCLFEVLSQVSSPSICPVLGTEGTPELAAELFVSSCSRARLLLDCQRRPRRALVGISARLVEGFHLGEGFDCFINFFHFRAIWRRIRCFT